MSVIVCYGDSNTWGYNPATQSRFAPTQRWTGVLRQLLGEGFTVIEEGLNGRTTVWDDPIEGYKNGMAYLPPCLESHKPLDLVIIMLGTNDLKARFSLTAQDIAKGAGKLAEMALRSATGPNDGPPQVLLLAPPPLAQLSDYGEMFSGGAAEKSRLFSRRYREVAELAGCHFLDTAGVIVSSDLDGIHFEAAEHRKLGQTVAQKVREILG